MGLQELNVLQELTSVEVQKIFEKTYFERKKFDKENKIDEAGSQELQEDIEIDISEFKQIEELFNDIDSFEIYKDNFEDNLDNYEEKKSPNKYKLVTKRIDSNKIRHKTARNFDVFTSFLKNIKMENENNSIRSGAIIYTHYEGKTYFCLGIDSEYGDLTDFAGGVKKDETVIEGGLRELEEESQGIFGKISLNEVENSIGFYTTNMLIMFIYREVNMEEVQKLFMNRIAKTSNNAIEVSGIVWIESKDFVFSILGKNRRVYSRVRKILSKVLPVIEEL